jgi:GDP/UDP-N,N'-diacetylbacillosamine 2-epimerase (hydrolysing)
MPNADTDGRVLIQMIQEFCVTRPYAKAFTSLGQLRYLSCIQHVDGVVGNSSSGLTEVPSFKKGTVNIGDRQRGRLRAVSVIDCVPSKSFILSSINELYSQSFRRKLSLPDPVDSVTSLDVSDLVVRLLTSKLLDAIPLAKRFYDCNSGQSDVGSIGSIVIV